MSHKYVYLFSEGDETMRNLLGGKGANLAQMTKLGMPVPQGFTVSTEACTRFYQDGKEIAEDIKEQMRKALADLETITGKQFGSTEKPLLVSVRSGARASMPGMMDTILNLGLNDDVAAAMVAKNDTPKYKRFVYDSYRRFIQMFSDVVKEVSKEKFDEIVDAVKEAKGYASDDDLTAEDMQQFVADFKVLYKNELGEDFPTDPEAQMMASTEAVFRSWDNPRANIYRRMHNIPYEWGTAVNVQEMVFGNLNENSGTGVAFTRNPATGEHKLFGEYLMNAQGEDVVAGIRTPNPIAQLQEEMPEIYKEFDERSKSLEKHYKDMQDLEFTVEDGKLFILQTRSGKRTAAAALKIAIDLLDEGLVTEEESLMLVDPSQLDTLLHPQFDPKALAAATPLGTGLAASPGAAYGRVVFTAEDAKAWYDKGEKVVLVRLETSPEDIEGMNVAEGILTARGGMTSHAAVVARGIGTPCVSGLGELIFAAGEFSLGGKTFKEGDYISLDGSTGNVYEGSIDTMEAEISGDFDRFLKMADGVRRLDIRTNADTPTETAHALEYGAQGVGLCRTEHMFFEADRIKAMREMIVAKDTQARKTALAKIEPIQQGDFEAMYRVLKGFPMTVRLLDPPLHEFLPTREEDIAELAADLNITVEDLNNVIASKHEFNPMMGHRGLRLAVTYPEIAAMQTSAIIKAAINVSKEQSEFKVVPEIMIPLVGEAKELKYVKDVVVATADALIAESGIELEYLVGTMIEIPRATLTADEIAKEADFFSFGTNDLTQMTFGFSRDDAGNFLDAYYENNIYEFDPFATIDIKGVGKLVETAVELGTSTKPNLKLGVCGEHGGDPRSIEFFHNTGLQYVSCSPFRVPIARLAAAQAAIKEKRA